MNTLDDRIRDVVQTIGRTAHDPVPYPGRLVLPDTKPVASPPRRPKLLVGLAGCALIAAIVAAVVFLDSGVRSSSPGPASATVAVTHEVVRYSRTADPGCAAREPSDGTFDEARTDIWERVGPATPELRLQVRYPDGSTYDLIRQGTVSRPTAIYTRGQPRLPADNCGGGGSVQTPDAGLGMFAGLRRDSSYQHATGPSEPGLDSLGRPATILHATALVSYTGPVITNRVDDDTTWYTDPESGDVLERIVTTRYDGIGTVVQRSTSTDYQNAEVPDDVFSTNGYETVHIGDTAVTTTSTSTP